MTAMLATGQVRNPHVSVTRVPAGRPFTWLSRGWMDMRRHLGASIGYGALIVGLGWTVLIFCGTHPYYVAAAFSGFLLGAPVISAGCAEISRRYEAGEPATFDDSLAAFTRRSGSLLALGGILAACAAVWFAVSAVMLETVFHVAAPSMRETLYRGFLDQMNRQQVKAYVAVGGALAARVFVVSGGSVPLIIDKGGSVGRAMATSVSVAFSNIPAMIVWSALILVLTVVGYAPLLFGLLLVGPLLGHATWHAYRDTVH